MTYKILTSTIDHQLDHHYEEFESAFGFGPCGAYAALRREQGWGQVAVCTARTTQDTMGFSHYVIVDGEDIIDMANPLGECLTYTEIEILDTNEMPELCEDGEAISWLRQRFS